MKKKILIMSIDFLEQTEQKYIDEFINKIVELNFGVVFYSRLDSRLTPFSDYRNNYPNHIVLWNRTRTKDFIKENDKSRFLIIGVKDQDFFMANHNKLMLLVPEWYNNIDSRSLTYGLLIKNIQQLNTFINTISNQNSWYSINQLDNDTHIISLSDARSKYYSQSNEEREIMEIFHNILKEGKLNFYEIYMYHFLSSISNNQELFDDINIWGIFPSSSGNLNINEMFKFKERVRWFMNGRVPTKNPNYINYPNILIRHTPTTKSHFDSEYNRIKVGATRHFDTICLNSAYKNKLQGKNVCIFDDYLTHGNSFECARNLLKSAGVNKIIFVTLGTFRKDYQYQNYKLTGDIFTKDYNYELINKSTVNKNTFIINNNAKNEVENLHNIFNL